jgi:hypothetical protein
MANPLEQRLYLERCGIMRRSARYRHFSARRCCSSLAFLRAQLLALFDVVARPHARGDIAQGVLEALARGRVPELVVEARAMLTSWRGFAPAAPGRRVG